MREQPPVVVFDEIHKFSGWKGLVKGFFDTYADRGKIRLIVIGSARLEMFHSAGESLMGRYFRYRIHPLSVGELLNTETTKQLISAPQELKPAQFKNLVTYGGFPEPFLKNQVQFSKQWQQLRGQQLFQDDLRELTRIQEVKQLQLLSVHLARQVGMLTSYTSLANKIRVSIETIRRWVEVLSGLYYCFLLRPWSKNVTRSLLKEPKFFLWDWSTLSHPGARAENLIASHLLKAIHFWTDCGLGLFDLYFLRDKEKREVDFVVTKDEKPWFLVEVKLSENGNLSSSLEYFQKQTGAKHAFQVVLDAPYEAVDCFQYTRPVIVPARTFLSQLV